MGRIRLWCVFVGQGLQLPLLEHQILEARDGMATAVLTAAELEALVTLYLRTRDANRMAPLTRKALAPAPPRGQDAEIRRAKRRQRRRPLADGSA